jgi:GntR family transcriptional regulator
MNFTLHPSSGQPLSVQLAQQIRHHIAIGTLQAGDLLPGIRTLAESLVVSPNTVVRAYASLEEDGLIEMRPGSGAYVAARRGAKPRAEKNRLAQQRVQGFVDSLHRDGWEDHEILRMVEAALFYADSVEQS